MNWTLREPPFEVQAEALRRAGGRRGYAWFLEMGLGKTRAVLAEYMNCWRDGSVKALAVICPNSMKSAWKNEALDQLSADIGPIRIWETNKFTSHNGGGPDDPSLYIFNFESMLYGGGEMLEELVDSCPVYLAIDESVHIKNFNASTTKRIIELSKRCARRRILTGNPRPENVMDLWAQLRAIGELDGVNPYAFRARYAIMGGYMRKQVVGQKNMEELAERMQSYSFTALKKDWRKDLPEKIYAPPRRIKMLPEQAKLYADMWNDFLVMVNEREASAEQMINVLNKCQQISSGFLKDDEGNDHQLVAPSRNPKMIELLEILEEVPGKVIIPCFYRWTCFAVRDLLEAKWLRPALMIGRMSVEDIDAEKKRFNADDQCRAFVVQTRTGKYGHTLLGTDARPCHTTIFFENDYSLDARIQVEDRNHRHGQKFPVTYIDLSASPAEDRVIKRLQEKKEVSEEFLRSLAQGAVK